MLAAELMIYQGQAIPMLSEQEILSRAPIGHEKIHLTMGGPLDGGWAIHERGTDDYLFVGENNVNHTYRRLADRWREFGYVGANIVENTVIKS
jgi:hypothetical protein